MIVLRFALKYRPKRGSSKGYGSKRVGQKSASAIGVQHTETVTPKEQTDLFQSGLRPIEGCNDTPPLYFVLNFCVIKSICNVIISFLYIDISEIIHVVNKIQ